MTGWLSTIPYLFAIVGLFTASYFSDKTLNRKVFIWPFLLVASLAFYGSYLVGSSNFWLSFVLLVIAGGAMYVPYGPFIAVQIEILPKNVAPGAIALINSFGALGSFIGSYIVGYLNGSTMGFGASYIFMAGSLLLSSILAFVAIKNTVTKRKFVTN
jgi:sugar phosphate permease